MKPVKAFASWHAVPLHNPKDCFMVRSAASYILMLDEQSSQAQNVLHAPEVRFINPPCQMKHCSANASQYEAKMKKIYRAIFAIISAVATDFKNPIILFNLLAFICGKDYITPNIVY